MGTPLRASLETGCLITALWPPVLSPPFGFRPACTHPPAPCPAAATDGCCHQHSSMVLGGEQPRWGCRSWKGLGDARAEPPRPLGSSAGPLQSAWMGLGEGGERAGGPKETHRAGCPPGGLPGPIQPYGSAASGVPQPQGCGSQGHGEGGTGWPWPPHRPQPVPRHGFSKVPKQEQDGCKKGSRCLARLPAGSLC